VPKTTTRALAALALSLGAGTTLIGPQVSAVAVPVPVRAPAAVPAATSGSLTYSNRSGWEDAVLDQLNAERAANGLRPLRSSSKLASSAHKHNVAMARASTMSHQLPGEKSLGARVTAAGYTWSSCGENIAWNTQRSQDGVLALETAMYDETPPSDGHRRNILSATFTDVGVDVIEDKTHGRVWLTTDFGKPR
jgi:uncharacterized protein YkwD